MITFNTERNYEARIQLDINNNTKITQFLNSGTPVRIIGGNSSSVSSAESSSAESSSARKPNIILPYDDESPQRRHDLIEKASTAEVVFHTCRGARFNQSYYDFLLSLRQIMLGYNKEWRLKYVDVFLEHVSLHYYRSSGGMMHTLVLPISNPWCLYLCVPAHGKNPAEYYTIRAYNNQVFVDTEYTESNNGVIKNIVISAQSNHCQVTRYYQQSTLNPKELSAKLKSDADGNYRY